MNAACEQYGTDCPRSLPFTGLDVLVVACVAVILLAGGIYLAYSLWRTRR